MSTIDRPAAYDTALLSNKPSANLRWRQRLRAASGELELVTPPWVQRVWVDWVTALRAAAGGGLRVDVVSIGNTADAADLVAPEIGRYMGTLSSVLGE